VLCIVGNADAFAAQSTSERTCAVCHEGALCESEPLTVRIGVPTTLKLSELPSDGVEKHPLEMVTQEGTATVIRSYQV
jgi:hypothetical protein